MVEHVDIPDGEIHEPKGASTAVEGEVYVSDGAGSGNWNQPIHMGWEDYNDTGTPQALTVAVKNYLTNNAAGAFTNTLYKLPGSTGIWDPSTNAFNFASGGCEVGDTVDVRVDLSYTTNTTNNSMLLQLDFAIGTPIAFSIPVDQRNIDAAGTQAVVRFLSFYIGSEEVLNNPAKFALTPDTTGDTCTVKGWYVRVNPRKPRYE